MRVGNGSKLHEETKLNEDKVAPMVSYSRVTVLHESKKLTEQKYKNTRKKNNYVNKKQ